eukprot:CAMPEP_0179694098 /NCGR_PEP_ID=MMETSP0936-20121108/5599_1 /TAXON_ID=548131 ORGANISM="Ostreococcus mediterraneus, Strain clade-D-RCC2573" /NCGR_SAMPLE_ID=MMETSP0936 /ASSEMBLY_ACC=CAM_ASM_000574 /LENGTH=262 /DNA_ID=CAMNT_0021566851 /DNA_START=140 /DNA_END=927 /DNA_ORIENTATION=-
MGESTIPAHRTMISTALLLVLVEFERAAEFRTPRGGFRASDARSIDDRRDERRAAWRGDFGRSGDYASHHARRKIIQQSFEHPNHVSITRREPDALEFCQPVVSFDVRVRLGSPATQRKRWITHLFALFPQYTLDIDFKHGRQRFTRIARRAKTPRARVKTRAQEDDVLFARRLRLVRSPQRLHHGVIEEFRSYGDPAFIPSPLTTASIDDDDVAPDATADVPVAPTPIRPLNASAHGSINNASSPRADSIARNAAIEFADF